MKMNEERLKRREKLKKKLDLEDCKLTVQHQLKQSTALYNCGELYIKVQYSTIQYSMIRYNGEQ